MFKNLPKSIDLINKFKNNIREYINIYETKDKQINFNEKKIQMIVNVNFMDKEIIKQFNKLIKINLYLVIEQNKIINKISELKKKIINFEKDKIYPTEWKGGKVPGEILETIDGYRAIYDGNSRSFKFKNIKNSPKIFVCKNKQDCKIKAETHLYEYYDKLGKITNKYRYLNENII